MPVLRCVIGIANDLWSFIWTSILLSEADQASRDGLGCIPARRASASVRRNDPVTSRSAHPTPISGKGARQHVSGKFGAAQQPRQWGARALANGASKKPRAFIGIPRRVAPGIRPPASNGQGNDTRVPTSLAQNGSPLLDPSGKWSCTMTTPLRVLP